MPAGYKAFDFGLRNVTIVPAESDPGILRQSLRSADDHAPDFENLDDFVVVHKAQRCVAPATMADAGEFNDTPGGLRVGCGIDAIACRIVVKRLNGQGDEFERYSEWYGEKVKGA